MCTVMNDVTIGRSLQRKHCLEVLLPTYSQNSVELSGLGPTLVFFDSMTAWAAASRITAL